MAERKGSLREVGGGEEERSRGGDERRRRRYVLYIPLISV